MTEEGPLSVKIESNDSLGSRKDPTSFLPDEPMSYEIKKKKKKKKHKQEDPFKDIEIANKIHIEEPLLIDPEVTIKAENIEVDLDVNDVDFDNLGQPANDYGLQQLEPIVKLEETHREALLLTFENVVKNNLINLDQNLHDTPDNFVCKICHLVFLSDKTLKMHQRRKHQVFRKKFKYICDHCSMAYLTKNSLIAHLRRKHDPKTAFDMEERTCEVCALVFKGVARLRMHMRRKHGSFEDSFKYACDTCGLTYEKYRSLLVHMQRKHSNSLKVEDNHWYACPLCPVIFRKRESYARHIQRKHKVNEDGGDSQGEVNRKLIESCKNPVSGEICCQECPLVFSSLTYLKLHMRRKHNAFREDFRLKCAICNLSYDKVESLKKHIKRKHDRTCHFGGCSERFGSLDMPIKQSHIKEVKECVVCGLIFASRRDLVKHLRYQHQSYSLKTIFCKICNEGFCEKRQLKLHYLKIHCNVRYTCKFCMKEFKLKESYRRHILMKHPLNKQVNNTENLQKCDQCEEAFVDEFELCQHFNMAHRKIKLENDDTLYTENNEKRNNNYQCTKCSDIYDTWKELHLHFKEKHQIKEESQCQLCGKMLPSADIAEHIKDHEKNEVVQCKYCEYKTNIKASLTQHMLRHKNATTMHCDFLGCRYKTYYESAMRKHKHKHNEQGVKLQCSHCPFQTMNKYVLKYHEEAHVTGKKRYACDKCDYATILPANLVQHKYKHSSVKRFKCEVCPFATKYNTSLRFHVKKKHCDLPIIDS